VFNPSKQVRWWLLWAAIPYGFVMWLRARCYERGWLAQRKLPVPVVSVGNLTLGGTGKTPVVILLTEWMLAQGRRVAILSRGYRRTSRERFLLVSDGARLLAGPLEAGDEPFLIAQRCPKAIVAVGADRYALGRWVLEHFPIDCFMLDDGFQHLALNRDVDLLLVDASDPNGLEALLPAGRLREPLSAASRADAVIVTRFENGSVWKDSLGVFLTVRGSHDRPILARFTAEILVEVATGKVENLSVLSGKTGVAFSGIGNAGSFRSLLAREGLQIQGERVFPDHHSYTTVDIEQVLILAEHLQADFLLTTEKDAVKIAPIIRELRSGPVVFALRLGTEIVEGRDQLEQLLLGSLARDPSVAWA
jgi:tetraacyldisaccharide 4'-kinase